MSKTIDERVVEMRFDNKQFETNAGQTMSTLEKLKNALNFSGSSKGLDELQKSANSVSFSGLEKTVDGIQQVFISAWDTIKKRFLENVVDTIYNYTADLVKSLSIDQVTAGWEKYADKTSAVQTIMAATAQDFEDTGEQMEYVNAQLEKLNWFTDETSYNFVDMVSNIGKFTSNNIALDDSVTAMQGIATWAALSGANATEASRAMYNLSQAIATGSVKLIDWKSIENANMATAGFKEVVLETAAAMGTLKKESDGVYKTIDTEYEVTVSNFSSELSEGWFTSEVLLSALDQYGSFTNKLYEISEITDLTATELLQWIDDYRDAGTESSKIIQDMANKTGVSAADLTAYMTELTDATYELGEKSFRAAQEAKTFQEAIDATKDAVSTGWMNTFEIIFGDYETAKVRWTALSNELYDVFAAGAEARNEMLTEALGLPEDAIEEARSGSELLFDGISQGWNAIKGIFSAMKQGWEVAFPAITADRLRDILGLFNSLTTRFNEWVGNFEADEDNPLSQTVTSIKNAFAGLSSVIGIGLDAIKAFASFLKDTFGASVANAIDRVLGFLGDIGERLVAFREWLQVNDVFRKGLDKLYTTIQNGINVLKEWFAAFQELPWVQELLAKISSAFDSFITFISSNFPNATEAVQKLFSAFQNTWKNKDFSGITSAIKDFASSLKDDLLGVWDRLKQTDLFGKFAKGLESIWNAIKNLDPSVLPNWARKAYDAVSKFLKPVVDFFKNMKDAIVDRAKEIGNGFLSFGAVLKSAAEYLREHIGGIIAALALFTTSAVVVKFIKTILNLATIVANPVESIVKAFNAFTGAAKGVKNAFNALAIVEIVAAIGGLALIAVKLGGIPPEQVWSGVGVIAALTGLVGGIIGLMALLTKQQSLLTSKQLKAQTAAGLQILEFAGALVLIAGAFALIIYTLKGATDKQITGAIEGLVGGLIALTGVSLLLSKFGGKNGGGLSTAAPVIAMAVALIAIVYAFKDLIDVLKDNNPEEINQALKVLGLIGGGLALFTVIMGLVSKIPGGGKVSGISVGLLATAIALKILISAFKDILEMDLSNFNKKLPLLKGIAGSIAVLMIALSAMPAKAGMNGVGLLAAAAAIEILAIAIRTMASMDTADIAKGVTAVGALLTFMAIFTVLTSFGTKMSAKSSLMFLVLSVSIGILAGVIALLSLLDPESVLIGTAAISALMVTFGVMVALTSIAKKLKIGTLIGLTAVIAVLGAVVIGLSLLDPDQVLIATECMTELMTMMGVMSALMAIAQGLKITTLIGLSAVVLALAYSIKIIADLESGVEQALVVMETMMGFFSAMSLIVGAASVIFKAGGGVGLAGVTLCIAIVAALGLVIVGICKWTDAQEAIGIMDQLNDLFLSLSALMIACSLMGVVGVAALIGIPMLAAVIAEIAILLAAINAINDKFPGVAEFLNSGLPLLNAIGESIGEFIGSIGVGITNKLPEMSQNLADSADGIAEFAGALSGIDENAVTGVKAVAEMLLALGASDLMGAITNLLGGEKTSLGELSAQLPDFATNLKAFSDNLGTDFNADSVSKAADAAADLTDMMNSLPTSGGWKQTILGDTMSLDTFGESLVTFAEKLGDFSAIIKEKEIDPDKITDVAEAASKLVDLVNNLPESGGWKQTILGEPSSLDTFSESLGSLGTGIYTLVHGDGTTAGIGSLTESDVASIDLLKTAVESIVDLQDALPEEDGWLTKIFGGEQLDISTWMNQISALGGLGSTIATFSKSLGTFGDELSDATGFRKLTDADLASIDTLKTAVQKVIELQAVLSTTISGNVAGNASAFSGFVAEIQNAVTNLANAVLDTIDSEDVIARFLAAGEKSASNYVDGFDEYDDAATESGKTLKTNALDSMSDGYSDAKIQGDNVGSGFVAGILAWRQSAYNAAYFVGQRAIFGLQNAIDAHSPSREAGKMGNYTGIGFVDSILDYAAKAYNAGDNIGSAALDGINAAIAKVTTIFDDDILTSPVIRPVVDLTDAQKSASSINEMFNHSIGMTAAFATTAGTSVEMSRTPIITTVASEQTGKETQNGQSINQYNTFNITSDDPEEVANRVSYILQRQVERKESIWA